MTKHTILLTGATGYIGSHTWLSLIDSGFDVVGIDNFSNSSPEVLNRLRAISGQQPDFVHGDVNDEHFLDSLFSTRRIAATVHFAAFKAVGESTVKPLSYYANNVGGLMSLCASMDRHDCKTLVFSSSATVYGQPRQLPIPETAARSAANPYGATKLISEDILFDLERADPRWKVAVLRYFNPVGAHPSGKIGEDPRGTPNNLMPYVSQVAVGRRDRLQVFGGDYKTADGTGVRDYIHVMDLAAGHLAALRYLLEQQKSVVANLGTGVGYSVLELIKAFEFVSGKEIPYELVGRRPGDIDACFADASLAQTVLGWKASSDLKTMCEDCWRWQQANPYGFGA